MLLVTTVNGSVYRIDPKTRTWERITKAAPSGVLQTEQGKYNGCAPVEIGKGLALFCPPLESGNVRLIYTSDVVSIEEVQ